MNYYAHHLGDYMRDTAHLSALEDGIYRRLIDVYYAREKALPSDAPECCRLARVSTKTERRALQNVLKEFFRLESDGLLHQKKCDEEIEKYNSKKNKARDSANARWNGCERNANAMPTHSEGNAPNIQYPITNNQEKKKSPRSVFDAGVIHGLDLKAWNRWLDYRREICKPLKPVSLQAAARQMAKLGELQADAVENSIANQYQGLVAPKANGSTGNRPTRYEQNMTALDRWNPDDKPADEGTLALIGPDVGQQVS